jgi:Family of unknown function (DUF5330)
MFLVRLAFWITVVALLLPTPDEPSVTHAGTGQAVPAALHTAPPPNLDMMEVADAAVASAEDVLSFCERNPSACETGLSIAGHVQRQVFHYGRKAISWIAAQGSENSNTSAQAHPQGSSEVLSPSASTFRGA